MTATTNDIPRSEYPRPQFVRKDWLCLNGPWQFEIDGGDSGRERGLVGRELSGRIIVPFCPEAPLSGVGNTDFMPAVWYRRDVTIPSAWAGRKVLLHFQAVDYDATVWVNGVEVGRHRGGFTPFTCDLGGVAEPGRPATIVVRARDNTRTGQQPGGKQSPWYDNRGCHYTRTTGIWQTVWLEPVAATHLLRPRITPDVAAGAFHVVQPIGGTAFPGRESQAGKPVPPDASRKGMRLRITLSDGGGAVATAECAADQDSTPQLTLTVPKDRVRLWSPADPHLYDLDIALLDSAGAVVDQAASYAGLRGVTIDGMAVRINGRSVFQRLVLDQGYYRDGIMTAPSDAALRRDIELSMAAGFNGARLHQKVFEERFLYHADRLGYLVWGEFGDWGMNRDEPRATYITQWLEAMERDYSHPSIVGWCPLNETWREIPDHIEALDDLTLGLFLATKAMDPGRPALDASGYSHRVANIDIYDSHDYEQDPAKFAATHAGLAAGKPLVNAPSHVGWAGSKDEAKRVSLPWRGQPYFVSEFGGIWWNPKAKEGEYSWGYGNRPKTVEEFLERFEKLCAVLLDNSAMFGYCYTQLTDVYQEQNGIYTFDREAKFDMERVKRAQARKAAIES